MSRNNVFLIVLLITLGCWHGSAHATACGAGCVQLGSDDVFSGTSNTVTLTGVAAGNALHILSCFVGPTAIGAVTLNGSATGVQIGGTGAAKGGSYTCFTIAAANMTGGSNTLVINYTGGASGCGGGGECLAVAEEWHGDATSSILDASNGTYSGGPGSNACGNMVTSNANDVLEAWDFTPQNSLPTVPAGYAFAFSSGGAGAYYSAYKAVAATGTYNPTWTSSSGGFDNFVVCGAFKQAGGAAVVNSRALLGVGQ